MDGAALSASHARGAGSGGLHGQEEPLLSGRQDPADPPPTFKEEDLQCLMEMGYDRRTVMEAYRRCSTREAAANWILSNQPM